MDKKSLGKVVKLALAKITDAQYFRFSKNISDRLLQEAIIGNAHTIALTLSNRPEVETMYLIEKLWENKKRVVVPKCNPRNRSMQFYEIRSFNQLETVYMNLREPIPEKTLPVNKEEIDVMIVPGVVYDLCGYRIGFGGGYYDRYLVNYTGALISLAFDLQVVQEVPREVHDIPIDVIITEERRIDCMTNREESTL